jgi:hypothetical protein
MQVKSAPCSAIMKVNTGTKSKMAGLFLQTYSGRPP